jgi:putative tryptophan/tyrosine transport system substrate-binding protein
MSEIFLLRLLKSCSDNLKSRIQNPKWLGFLVVAFVLVVAGSVTQAQQAGKMPRIGYLHFRAGLIATDEAFVQALGDLGWIEGKNIVIEYRWAAGKRDRYQALAEELVRLKVDIIVTAIRVLTQAAKNATSTIPIVMASAPDAVENGLVTSLARPGGNVTGMSEQHAEINTKLLELLHETLPKVTRVAWLGSGNPTAPAHVRMVRALQAAAPGLELTIQPLTARKPEELEDLWKTVSQERTGALIVAGSVYSRLRRPIAEFSAKNRIPVFTPNWPLVEKYFGLLGYGPDWTDMYRLAARYVDKILTGAKPAELPVQRPVKFNLVVNLKTAKQLGITIPPTVLYQATEVIK